MRMPAVGMLGTLFILAAGVGAADARAESDGCRLVLCLGAPNPGTISECASVYKEFLKGDLAPVCAGAETGEAGEIASTRTREFTACPAQFPVPSAPPRLGGDGRPGPTSGSQLSMCRSRAQVQECTGAGRELHCELVYRYAKRPTRLVYRTYQNGKLVAETPLD